MTPLSEIAERAARGTLWHALAQGTVMLSAYVVAVVLARSLGPAAYGIYGLVYSLLLTVELVGRLGIPQATSRLLAETPGDTSRLEATGFGVALGLYLGLFVGFWLLAPELARLFGLDPASGSRLLRLAALDIPVFGLFFMAVHVLNGHRAFAREACAQIVYALTKAFGILLLALLGASIEGALLVNVAGSLLGLLLLFRLLGRVRLALDPAWLGRILTLALPIGLTGLGTQVTTGVDLWSLGLFGTVPEEVRGHYVAALGIARMPNLLAFVLTAVLIPSLARALAGGEIATARRTLEASLRFLALTLLPGCVVVAIEAEPLIVLLFSEAYRSGGPLLRLLILGHGLANTLFVASTAVLIAIGAQHAAALLALLAVPTAFLANALLVPVLGATGAATAAILVPAMMATAAGLLLHRRLGLDTLPGLLRRAMVPIGGLALVAAAIPTSGLWLLGELALLVLLWPPLALAVGLLGQEDLAPLRRPVRTRAVH